MRELPLSGDCGAGPLGLRACRLGSEREPAPECGSAATLGGESRGVGFGPGQSVAIAARMSSLAARRAGRHAATTPTRAPSASTTTS